MIFKKQVAPTLLSLQRIWNQAPHSAMTDLIRYNHQWFCAFRESDQHVAGENGHIRIITSKNGLEWNPAAVFAVEGVDLRDPKLSITPHGKLMLLAGGTVLNLHRTYDYLQSRVAFSDDGFSWSPFQLVLEKHEWLWRVTWYQGRAYGASYSRSVPSDRKQEWYIKLFESNDGIVYNLITQWPIQGYPNETTLRFRKNGEMVALVRRDKKYDNHCWLGTSPPPYNQWHWSSLQYYVGGPNFLILPDETMWVSGRLIYKIPYAEIKNICGNSR